MGAHTASSRADRAGQSSGAPSAQREVGAETGGAWHCAALPAPPALADRVPRVACAEHEALRLCAQLLGTAPPARLAQLLAAAGLAQVARMSAAELESRAGLGPRLAARLQSAFALGRRAELERLPERPCMRSPARVWRQLLPELRGQLRERFLVLLLDGKYRLRRMESVSEGTLTSSLVHPREVFGPAVREAAAALVVAHNHPSGDPEPSAEDVEVTARLVEVGKLLGIPLLDHLVVADESFVSLRQRMNW